MAGLNDTPAPGATHRMWGPPVFTAGCTCCGACLLTCPTHAIRPIRSDRGGSAALSVLARLCTGCGECVEICPADAVRLAAVNAPHYGGTRA